MQITMSRIMHLATGTGNRGGADGTCADLRQRDLPEYTIHHLNSKVNLIIEIARIPAHLLRPIHGKILISDISPIDLLRYGVHTLVSWSFLIIRYCT